MAKVQGSETARAGKSFFLPSLMDQWALKGTAGADGAALSTRVRRRQKACPLAMLRIHYLPQEKVLYRGC